MLKLAAGVLAFGGLLALCWETEKEPNGSIASATVAGPVPASAPQVVCGVAGPGAYDLDLWRVKLEFPTAWYCEVEARFQLSASLPGATLVLLQPSILAGSSPYRVVGVWHSATGWIDTGHVALEYHYKQSNHAIAVVKSWGAGPANYALRFW